MERSASLDIEALKMTQEQYILAAQPNSLHHRGASVCGAQVYPAVGIYGWRKRCLYFFILLLLVTMIVNLALTIWILKVMNFTPDGMGNLRVTKEGVRLEGVSEFLLPLYVKEIQSRRDSPLIMQSDRNVTINARNGEGQLTGQLTVGSEMVEVQCQRFEVKSADGERVLFSADEEAISIGTEKLRVTGSEGVVFSHSVQTSHVRAEPSQDLKLESPTRTLTLEAPRGVDLNAGVGDFTASCRKDLLLQSSEGEIFLDANTIRLGNIPLGSAVDPLEGAAAGTTYTKQTGVYELCACANGKLYLSPAEKGSTCRATSNFCLWS
ncbi:zeta-sarcoglycan isoform X1 [Dunckerocampus dactyliophorus]|uniref:zeta-sarcoglycan isoform X1 n=2 Tax=Dunckerocampus dactyliophorus TaxID=161453 RepID=UPI002405549C|nr:zeta-sarcoglycan isoform X1 [Dunckerocampus dactyliophorus]